MARTVVRHHDSEHLHHCRVKLCGDDCLFLSVSCPNKPCPVVYSSCWRAKHDALCPQKIVPCTRQCGEEMPRMLVSNHKEFSCPLRSVIFLPTRRISFFFLFSYSWLLDEIFFKMLPSISLFLAFLITFLVFSDSNPHLTLYSLS